MLKLKNIKKDYQTSLETVHALKGINITFRKSEFVSILGQSGCGKTTLLNIIGGLDRYTEGDLIIEGKSTKDFTSKDWDNYRNHSVGFIFQNYNLISHQTILENVEIALTLSGVNKKERKKRATEVLEKVGLKDKLNVKPNQLSGGQMQRVAIARALVNDPEVLLADEPTGALDSKTSVQIMDLLKEIAKERLVIMVTHNPELANKYSTRIISLSDGEITNDTLPYDDELESNKEKAINETNEKTKKTKKTSMSFWTALTLSFRNLLTKKARTLLVAFAGSIGLIGIATILSISSGFKGYIKNVEEDTLSGYPISIQDTVIDMTSSLISMKENNENVELPDDTTASYDVFVTMMKALSSGSYNNNLKEFKVYIEQHKDEISKYVSSIKYGYSTTLNIYEGNTSKINQVNPSSVFSNALKQVNLEQMANTLTSNMVVWSELIDNQKLLDSQYDCVYGSWPRNYNEIVIKLDKNGQIPDYALYALGLKTEEELVDLLEKVVAGEEIETSKSYYRYEDLMNLSFNVVLACDYYEKSNMGYTDKSTDEDYLRNLIDNGIKLKVVGIVKVKESAAASSINGVVAYHHSLMEYVIKQTSGREIVKKQLANSEVNVLTGLPFTKNIELSELLALINMSSIDEEMKKTINNYINMLKGAGKTDEEIVELIISSYGSSTRDTYESVLQKLGVSDLDNPSSITLYPIDFASKDKLTEFIDDYNKMVKLNGNEKLEIKYTDYIGLLLSSISTIIDAITYVLFAFVAISLVVSSIMIGVITYISVLERIKEIGILRSVGASKKDISHVFNAETTIIGLASGILGIGITLLLIIPINLIIKALADISNVAKLPVGGAFILIALSVVLSLIAGIIPSMIAANKNPVEALRSE